MVGPDGQRSTGRHLTFLDQFGEAFIPNPWDDSSLVLENLSRGGDAHAEKTSSTPCDVHLFQAVIFRFKPLVFKVVFELSCFSFETNKRLPGRTCSQESFQLQCSKQIL